MPKESQWIVVRNWEKFQHYKDAWPIWVKWYTGLLHDAAFTNLPMGTRGVFAHLLLLYAGCRAELPRNTRWISRQINGHVTRTQLEALNHAGFISFEPRPCLEHVKRASSPRALARVEESREATEEEALKASSSSAPPPKSPPPATPHLEGASPAMNGQDDEDPFDLEGLKRISQIAQDAAMGAEAFRAEQQARLEVEALAELASEEAEQKRDASRAWLDKLLKDVDDDAT